MNLGTIESKVKVDGLAEFGADLKKTDATMEAFAQQTSKRFARVETDVKAAAKATGMSAQDMQSLLDRAMKSISADTATKSLERMARQMGLSKKEAEDLGRQLGLSAQTIETLTGKLAGAGFGMSALVSMSTPLAGAIAGAFSIAAVAEMGRAIGETKLQFESMERAMKTVAGTQAGASAAMQYVADTSDKLGVRLTAAAEGYKTIAAAAKGTTLEGAGARAAFESVSEASAALGLSSDQSSGALLALGQMISKGKVQAEELRGQLGERLPGAFQIAARAMGMTTAELDDMMSKGGLITNDFLPKFAAELHKTYGQAAVDAGNSGQASFNKLANSWDQLKLALADTGAWSVALSFVGNLTAGINKLSAATREAAGTMQGLQKIQAIESKIQQAKNNIDMAEAGRGIFSGLDDMGILESKKDYITRQNNEIIRLEQEGAAERQKVSEQTRHEYARRSLAQINKQAEDEAAAIRNGQKETLKAWEGSSDKKISLWAKRLSDATEAYQKAYKGEITQGAMEILIAEADKKYVSGIEGLSKKGSKGANSAARYESQTDTQLQQYQGMVDQLKAQLEGDTLEAKLAGIEKKYAGLIGSVKRGMIDAKGSIEFANASLEKIGEAKALEITKAQIDAWKKSMQDAGSMLGKIGQMTGDPTALYASKMVNAQLWQSEQQTRINNIADPAERAKQQAELVRAAALDEADARKSSYENSKAFSSVYWNAERERIQNHLEAVKGAADDETAYKIYAAQQWDEYNKTLLEKEIAYAGSFATTFAAKWSLAFGSYKSDITKSHEEWGQMSDAIITLNKGLISSVSGGFGDFFRKIKDGTATTADLFDYMCNRMYDAVANFVEKTINDQLSRLAQSLGGSVGSWLGNLLGIGSSTSYSASDVTSAMASTGISPWTAANAYASGGAFPAGTSLPLGTIIDKPTFFSTPDTGFHAFASGGVLNNVAGEKGPEVLFPLTSIGGKQGILGRLDTSGSSTQQTIPNISITLENRSGQEMKATKGKTVSNQDGLFVTYFLDLVARNSNNLRTGMQGLLGA